MSEAYLTQIQQLVELQKVDDEIFDVRGRREEAPRYLEELEERYKLAEAKRGRVREKLDHLQDQKRRLDNEMEEDAARLKKSRNKLMQVTNDREYQAMQREVDNMEKQTRSRDEEKAAVEEELGLQNNAMKDLDQDYNQITQELETRRASLEETLASCNEQLAVLEKKRKKASEFIPPAVFQRYEFIRKRLEHPVIVAVEDGICTGCNIAIPPQAFIDLQSGQQIQSCPNCQRLIYWSEHFEDPDRIARKRESVQQTDSVNEDESEE